VPAAGQRRRVEGDAQRDGEQGAERRSGLTEHAKQGAAGRPDEQQRDDERVVRAGEGADGDAHGAAGHVAPMTRARVW
jgi:hypothetical protein